MEDNQMLKRLDLIISLLLEVNDSINKDRKLLEREKMYKLKKLGFENEEIARILGVAKKKVSKQLYEVKRKKKH